MKTMIAADAATETRTERPQHFDLRRTDIWRRTGEARSLSAGDKDIAFQHLTLTTSANGALYGARFFERRRWFGRREVLNITIANDRGRDDPDPAMALLFGWRSSVTGYSLWAHGAGYEPAEIASFNGPDIETNADAAARAFKTAVAEAVHCKTMGPLSETMPRKWLGKHWRTMFSEEYIEPNRQGINVTLMFTMFILPCLLFFVPRMGLEHLVMLIGGLFWSSCLVSIWLPQPAGQDQIGPIMRWSMTFFGLLALAVTGVILL
jgi:hypothetical protein